MRVVAAMSGGVDSSVTAALLLEQGHDVIGVHMKLHNGPPMAVDAVDTKACCGLDDVIDCRRVADQLGIPFYVMDLRKEFERAVMDNFRSEYIKGRTPNPCVQCNGVLKFRILLRRAKALGASHLATGHYAQITEDYGLRTAVDPKKDQSYFLFPVTREALKQTFFPLGGMTKSEVRAHASRLGLATASKRESQDICFLPNGNHAAFIDFKGVDGDSSGNIVDEEGTILGQHDAYYRYTIGQRKGLGIASPQPLYVLDIRSDSNEVVVGPGDRLFNQALEARQLNWYRRPERGEALHARIRHRGPLIPCELEGEDPLTVHLSAPARAITPGQAIVIYSGTDVVAGGWINRTLPA